MNKEHNIALFTAHRENINAAKSFDEYKKAHVEYIDTLLSLYELEEAHEEIINKFAANVWRKLDDAL